MSRVGRENESPRRGRHDARRGHTRGVSREGQSSSVAVGGPRGCDEFLGIGSPMETYFAYGLRHSGGRPMALVFVS